MKINKISYAVVSEILPNVIEQYDVKIQLDEENTNYIIEEMFKDEEFLETFEEDLLEIVIKKCLEIKQFRENIESRLIRNMIEGFIQKTQNEK